MNREEVKRILDRHTVEPLGIDHRYAVFCGLIDVEGEVHVIFEKRSSKLSSHTGEVSLPGGRIEAGETPKEAALRETLEELRVAPEQIEILGEADYYVTRRNKAVHCFIGVYNDLRLEEIDPGPDEVDYVFSVPLSVFLDSDPEVRAVEYRQDEASFPYELVPQKTVPIGGFKDHIFFYRKSAESEKERTVWGMTAKIMYGVAQLLRQILPEE